MHNAALASTLLARFYPCLLPAHLLPVQDVEAVYSRLYSEYREEYVMFNLASAALSAALPRVMALLRGWSPLAEPQRGVRELRRLRALLDPHGSSSGG